MDDNRAPQRPLLAGAAWLSARGLAGRDGIYQLIRWVRHWDRGEPSVPCLLPASRTARQYLPDRVLNAAGNGVNGLNAGRAKFQMGATVAIWQHGVANESDVGRGANAPFGKTGSLGRIRKRGTVSAGAHCRGIVVCNEIRGERAGLRRVPGKHGVSNMHGASATR
jgi:hypothetical protein